MGMFDFFKKAAKKKKQEKESKIKRPKLNYSENKSQKSQESLRKVSFSEIEDFLKNKENENKEKEITLLNYLSQRKESFIRELKTNLENLRNTQPDPKKSSDQRVRLIVLENKDKYIYHAENMIEKLQNLETDNFGIEEAINKINKIFEEFHNKSSTNYEKTTVLIGKEIAEVRKLIKSFSDDLVKLFDENKPLLNEMKFSSRVKSKINQINNIDSGLNETEKSLKSLNENIEKKKHEREKISEKIQKIKNSEKYKERLEKQDKIKQLQKQLDNSILDLKQEIDFKELANFFHVFPEKIRLVKDYKENFSIKFREDKNEILDLLGEAGLKNSIVSDKIEKIKNKEKELEEIKNSIPEDETSEEYNKLDKIEAEIDSLENKKSDLEKKKNKLKENKQDLVNSLKSDLNKLNAEIV